MQCKWLNVCPLRKFEEKGKLGLKWKKEYCERNYGGCKRFQLQEVGEFHPDNMLPNGEVDKNLK